jgi:hypothetical protein
MICTPGKIRVQLLFKSYCRMQHGKISAVAWNSRLVESHTCGKVMLATSLGCHLSDFHDIYQLTEVSEDLLDDQPPSTYTVTCQRVGKLACPFPRCEGVLNNG